MFKKIPFSVWVLGGVSFFNDVASEMLYPIMPIFLTQVLGAPVFVVGLIEGVAEGLSSFLKTFFGVWSDRLQKRKPFVFSGYLFSALAKIIIAISYSWPLVFLGRVVDRFGKGLRTGARDALLLEAADKNNKGLIFGFHRSLDSAGAVIGPLIALLLLSMFHNNYRIVLILAAVPAFFGLSLIFLVKDTAKKVQTVKTKLTFSLKGLPLNLKLFLLVVAVFSLGNSSDTFLILRAKGLGMSMVYVILAYTLYNFTYSIISTPAGELADKIGAKTVFIIGLVVYSLVYLGFALNQSTNLIWLLFLIYGFYIALTDGVSKALIGSMIQKEKAGSAYGVLTTITSIGTLLASVIGGFLWTAFSPSVTFFFGAGCAFLAFVLYVFIHPSPLAKSVPSQSG